MALDRDTAFDVGLDMSAQSSAKIAQDKFRNRKALCAKNVDSEALGLKFLPMSREIIVEMFENDMAALMEIDEEAVVIVERGHVQDALVWFGLR